jgi:outer membrane protein assembly factor BamB
MRLTVVLLSIACAIAAAAEPKEPRHLPYRFITTDYGGNKVCVVGADGKIEWSYPARRPQDAWLLPNGNILLTQVHAVQEVTPDKKVAWEYKTAKGNEIHACQPLPDDLVMIIESGPFRIIEVDRDGKIAKEVKLQTKQKRAHGQNRNCRKLANGNYLVGQYSDQVIREYDPTGKIVWEFKHKNAFGGIRLKNGNTLISTGDAHRVVEVDPKGNVVWEIRENELPGNPLRFVAGMQRLANGNTLICNWGGHGHVGQQPQIVEVSRDKKVVSELWDDQQFKTISGVFVIGEKGDVRNFGLTR